MSLFIRAGTMVDPVRGTAKPADLLVERGKIARIAAPGEIQISAPRIKTIDATGRLVVPGLLDMHVHLREPGHEYKETVESGGRAGVRGGFSSLACMPNTRPANDSRSVTEYILEQAQRAKLCRVHPIAAITAGRKGEELTEFGDLKAAGAVGVSDDGYAVSSSEVMRRALEYARYHKLCVISHCEDRALSSSGVMHEGAVSTEIGLPGIPAAGEEIMVYREIALAKLTGCPVHIAHVSTAGSVELIRRAKSAHIPVTAETAPHYFTLDHTAVIGYDTRAKVNPPLRTPADVAAIKTGLAEGVIDVIASDHAPHSPLEKDLEFDQAEFGMIGLETVVPLTLALVREGVLSMHEAVAKLTVNPSRILGVGSGRLAEGQPADLALIDPETRYELREAEIASKSKNSPFIGKSLRGRTDLTMIGGKIVWRRKPQHPGR